MKVSATLFCVCLLGACAIRPQPADIVLTNGIVWSGTGDEKPQQAIAIRNGRIVDVGSNETIQKFVLAGTRVIDLHGRLVVPGFIDDNTHFMAGGYQLTNVNLRDAGTPKEFTRRIANYVRAGPGGTWM